MMVDIETIKENYRRMSDDQLVRFAQLESENLLLASFHALKDELHARNIDLDIIEQLPDVDIPKTKDEAVTEIFLNSLFEYAIEERSNGVSNTQIYHGLVAKNIGPEQALMLIQMLDEVSSKTLKNIETEITVAWISVLAGLFLCLFTFEPMGIKFFIGVLIIIGACAKLANSYQHKQKIARAIENGKDEEDPGIKGLYQ